MTDKESKQKAIEKEIDEAKLIGLQLKYPSKHLDVFLPLMMRLASKMFRVKVIASQPIFPSGGVEVGNNHKLETITPKWKPTH